MYARTNVAMTRYGMDAWTEILLSRDEKVSLVSPFS